MLHQCVYKSRRFHNHANNIPQTPENQCSFILYVCSKHNYYAYHLVMSCKWLYKTFLWYKKLLRSSIKSNTAGITYHLRAPAFLCVWCYKSYLVFYFFGMFVFFLCLVPNFASLPGFITNSWFAYGFLSRWYYHLYYPFGTTTTPYMYFTYCYYELYKCITLFYDNYCQLRHIMYEFSV
jgi:hypothetical protein